MIENSLDTDDIRGLVWRLALPSMLAQFVSVFYSIVDRMYIGNIPVVGEKALAGVGICGPIVTLISSVAFLVGIGGAPLISIRLGEKNERAAKQILANCFLMLAVLSVTITLLSLLLKRHLLLWFGASPATYEYANGYLTIYLAGTAFALMATGMNQFIICQGFAKIGMKSVLLGAVLNIVLDPVFIFWFRMGVQGAAVATVISQAASSAYILLFLFRRAPIHITFREYDLRIVGRILTIGITPFLIIASDNILIISLNTVIQRFGGAERGDMLLTCTTIVQSFMLIVTMPLGGITSGTQTILGFNYGARRPDRIKKAEKHIFLLGFLFTTAMFLIANTASRYFVYIFTRDEAYVELTVWAIRVYTMGIIPLSLQYTVVDGFTGMGLSLAAVSLTAFRKSIFFIGVFLIPALWDITYVFYTEPIADIVAAAVSGTIFLCMFERLVGARRRQSQG